MDKDVEMTEEERKMLETEWLNDKKRLDFRKKQQKGGGGKNLNAGGAGGRRKSRKQ